MCRNVHIVTSARVVSRACAAAFAEVVDEARETGGLDADALIGVGRKP